MLSRLDSGFARLLGAFAVFGAILGLLMVAVVSADVLLRVFGGRGIVWSGELSEYGLYLMTLSVAPWLLRHGQHVKIDVLSSRVPGRAGRLLEQAVDVVGAIICGVIAWYGFAMVVESREAGSTIVKNLAFAEWILLMPLPMAFVLLAIEFGLGLLRPPEPPTEEVRL